MKKSGIDFEEFLKKYNHIAYFECIMYPDGTLEEARPSHIYKMCEIYDKTKNIYEIEKNIPEHIAPIEWLLRECNCVALWYESLAIDFRYQKLTEIQRTNIIELSKRGYIRVPSNIIQLIDEKKQKYENFLLSLPEHQRKEILIKDKVEILI